MDLEHEHKITKENTSYFCGWSPQEEIEKMKQIVQEAVQAGAYGFSTSRTEKHNDVNGNLTPSITAHKNELVEIAKSLGEINQGNPVNFFIPSEQSLIDRISPNYKELLFAEEFEGIGHWTQQEAPEEVNNFILNFLEKVS